MNGLGNYGRIAGDDLSPQQDSSAPPLAVGLSQRGLSFVLVAFTAVLSLLGCRSVATPSLNSLSSSRTDSLLRQVVPGSRISFVVHSTSIANLIYQLDCLTVTTDCRAVFTKLWHEQLGWNSQDQPFLDEWQALRRRYANAQFPLHSDIDVKLHFPFENPSLDYNNRIRLAAYRAADLESYLNNLRNLVTSADLARAEQVVGHFQPRFNRWWSDHGRKIVEPFLTGIVAQLKAKQLDLLVDEMVDFYQSVLPEHATILVNLIGKPKTKFIHNEQIEDVSVLEVIDPNPRHEIDQVLHELAHYLYQNGERLPLREFLETPRPTSIAAFNLFNETLATVFQALVDERVMTPDQFAKHLAIDRSLYSDPFIDPLAKAMIPVLRAALVHRRIMDIAFVQTFLDQADATLGTSLEAPLLRLRTGSLIFGGESERPLANLLSEKLNGQHIEVASCFGESRVRQQLVASLFLSGALILTAGQADCLKSWDQLIPLTQSAAIESAARIHGAIVYAVARSPKSALYVFVGRDHSFLRRAIEQFSALDRTGDGLLLKLDSL